MWWIELITEQAMTVTRFVTGFGTFFAALIALLALVGAVHADPFNQPWRLAEQALVIDAYEKNPIDWKKLRQHKAIRGFVGKSSDGLPPPYSCKRGNDTAYTLCKKTFQNYWLKRELYHTRRMIAKNIGLKWGAYHLGRPGNPIDQANHFIDFTDPEPDELIALDIEHDNPKKWISFKDAETFVRHVHFRTGRYPVLYTNHDTAKRIAAQADRYPLLSRLPLWYARFRSNIRGVFPLGNWDKYAMWQFSARANCNKRRCLYRVKGTKPDIDVNATGLTISEFENAWPFNGLVPRRDKLEGIPELLLVKQTDPKPGEPVERYKMAVEIELEGKSIQLASIAVPTARIRQDEEIETQLPDIIHTASAGVKQTGKEPGNLLVAGIDDGEFMPVEHETQMSQASIELAEKRGSIKSPPSTQTFQAEFEFADANRIVRSEVVAYQYTSIAHANNRRDHVAERYYYWY